MISRILEKKIRELRGKFPVLVLTGPRQSGKTTLLKSIYNDLPYVSLEDLDNRLFAAEDPRGFLANYPSGAFLDEVQNVPEIFNYLQAVVDGNEKVHFALSGSQNFLLLEKISQTLAGRTAMLKLLPLSLRELNEGGFHFNTFEEAIFQGAYPRVYKQQIHPSDFFPGYISTYVERDVRQVKNIGDLRTFTSFLKLCAGRTGQLLNMNSLAMDAGISPNTAKAWLSVLEAGYIIHFLQPHHNNYDKRIVKSPKLYFVDTGLACSLLQIENEVQLQSHYLRGGLFENMVVNEFLKMRFNAGKSSNLYFWQSKDKKEVDLLLDKGDHLIPFEIKSSKTRQPHLLDNLKYWSKLSGHPKEELHLVYGGDEDFSTSQGKFVSWRNIDSLI